MSDPDPKPPRTFRGLTEEQWRTAREPFRLARGWNIRATPRKSALVACAHVLNTPGPGLTPLGRRVGEIVQAAVLAAGPEADRARLLRDACRTALHRELPEYFGPPAPDRTYDWNAPEPALPYDDRILRTLWSWWGSHLNRAMANVEAADRLRQIRNAVWREARERWDATERSCLTVAGPNRTEATREALLALFPAGSDLERYRKKKWCPEWPRDWLRYAFYRAVTRLPVEEARAQMADIVRDVIGNPFRPAVAIAPEWREANFGAVRRIAEHIAATRDFSQVPILGDALEEAGCRDEEMLAHCRIGEHVPGCWVVDAVLGRN